MEDSKYIIFILLISVLNGERLEHDRLSCSTPNTVYIETGVYWWTTSRIMLNIFSFHEDYWDALTDFECQHKRTARIMTGRTKGLNRTNLADPLIEDLENRWRQDENFRMFFVEKEAKVMNGTIPLEVTKMLMKSEESPFSIGCKDNKINVNIKMMSLEAVNVIKCEDVGEEVQQDFYEYFDISTPWMWESKNLTYYIQEEKCTVISGTLLCPETAIKQNPICSVYNIELCEKTPVHRDPESPTTSYVRQLPGGVSVFGTFKQQTQHNEGAENRTQLLKT
ncbi:hypothetical protein CRE_12876 [Caenorhabditis remanei]|uniref:Uncharacterized protein n=1 Tax=Caenorhabditis remanei TaxID=31234 RepID=E3MQR1_CAERE|nr:hypothetical protein CRE_12876 [Caenorhabditis remanei]